MTHYRFDPDKHHRRSIRLQGYDYTQAGAYFITMSTHNREWLFGKIVAGQMQLNQLGQIVAEEWLASANIRTDIELDAWIVMPNHFHGIVVINDTHRLGDRLLAPTSEPHRSGDRPVAPSSQSNARPRGPAPRSIGALIAGFKAAATKRINQVRQTPSAPVWQRDYWDHIIRDEAALNRIREYIHNNPARWGID